MVNALGIPCDALIAREDAAAKPDPDGLLKLARRFRLHCDDMLCVGDFLYDLQAAARAGMRACLYDPEGASPHRAMAEYVVSDFDELADLLYGDSL
jgi:phosphoglycolate phosphatase-like HAD superfamily hydrolase